MIFDPEPELQDAGVVKAQPHEGSLGPLGLQLGPGLGLFVKDGSQAPLFGPAVVQGFFPRLILFDQLKG